MAAARVLFSVIDRGQSLDAALERVPMTPRSAMPALREICYGGCRYYVLIDAWLSCMLHKPVRRKERLVHFVMVAAIYRLRYMRTPDHAVVNESVNALGDAGLGWAGRLVNGVLRRYIRQHEELVQRPWEEHVGFAFRRHQFERLRSDWPDHYRRIAEASNSRPPLTLRINRRNATRESYIPALDRARMAYAPTPDSPSGVVLSHPVPVQEIPGFRSGLVSVQDESAQLVADVLELSGSPRILDACAAPGGKTCHILETMPDGCELVALDLEQRTGMIRDNLSRLGVSCTVVGGDVLKPAAWWDGRRFDRILLDAPCSGSGVIRRHPDIKHRRREEDCERFHEQQVRMLESLWKLLHPEGILLYVTCSVFRRENDESIDAFIGGREDCEPVPLAVPGIRTGHGIQRLPGVHTGDGFYYCRLRKVISTGTRDT